MKYVELKIASILFASIASMIGSLMFQPANAQITNNAGTNQNMAGLIPVTLNQTLVSQIKTSLSNVTAIAEKTTGAHSYAVLAALETQGGSLVYTVWVADSGFNFHRVQIDPANGKVLSSQPLTIAMRQQALLEMQRGMMSLGQSPGQGGMMNPSQAVPSQAAPGQGGIGSGQGGMMNPSQAVPSQAAPGQGGIGSGQGGMMSPGQAAPGQGGMAGKP